jgi:enoyl-[acyl-carrier protein] reductase II
MAFSPNVFTLIRSRKFICTKKFNQMTQNRICNLFAIQFPVIQAGMVWCSGHLLASAVANAGGLGLLGSGSMRPEELRQEIRATKALTQKPFGVNIPLISKYASELVDVVLEEKVGIVFTSAGSPAKYAEKLKSNGVILVHVVSSSKFAKKAEEAGCDAVVAEGFEAGGHNGREETTTMCLIPAVCQHVKIPVIAAGGIGSGKAMLAAFALGADGVQIGSRFVASEEASCHPKFKELVINLNEGDTVLTLKELQPVRLVKNDFYQKIEEAYAAEASHEQLQELLGTGRAKKGMLEGDLKDGELEIGQVSATIRKVLPAGRILEEIISEFKQAHIELNSRFPS